ncbi:MAG: hypothetical protein K2L85_02060 [Paramuribaculum sp.]|nr:hypothetical protein [Paramuribaculum sp.]
MLWKHRDTSHSENYVDTVSSADPRFDYVALFNADDTLKLEAWAGVNRSGFAVMNTVAGNLPRNSARWKDREGFLMSRALQCCVTVDDFRHLLDTLPRPLGVRANFGVLDMYGHGAYFETDDNGYEIFWLHDTENDLLVRSNYAVSGSLSGGYGYERYRNACAMLVPSCEGEGVTPQLLTDFLSREYYNSASDSVYSTMKRVKIPDKDFIPRPTSASSVVIELRDGKPVMWCMLGYPPASYVLPATVDSVSDELRRDPSIGTSRMSAYANSLKNKMIRNGKILMPAAKEIADEARLKSIENYEAYEKK